MRRLGGVLLILGVIMVFASPIAAWWWAHTECALQEAGRACQGGTMTYFIDLLATRTGLMVFGGIVLGIVVIGWGMKVLARHKTGEPMLK